MKLVQEHFILIDIKIEETIDNDTSKSNKSGKYVKIANFFKSIQRWF